MKRYLSTILIMCILLLLLVSCNVPEDTAFSSGGESLTETTSSDTKRETVTIICGGDDDYIDWKTLDFEGEKLTILAYNSKKLSEEWAQYIFGDENALDTALLKRNADVERDLDLDIQIVLVDKIDTLSIGETIGQTVKNDVLNGLCSYDIVANCGFSGMSPKYRDLWSDLLDKEEFSYFNFDLPCWNNSLWKNCSANGSLYVCAGDLNISMFDSAGIIWHNVDLYDEIKGQEDADNIQDLVIRGDWTYDELYRWSAYVSHEDDTDSKTYGLWLDTPRTYEVVPYAWDICFVEKDDLGRHAYRFTDNDKAENALKMLRELYMADGAVADAMDEDIFANGKTLFKSDVIRRSELHSDTINGMSNKHTILPWPKYDQDQNTYLSTSTGDFTTVSVVDYRKYDADVKGDAVSAYLQYANELSYVDVRGYYLYEVVIGDQLDLDYEVDVKAIAIFHSAMAGITFDHLAVYAPALDSVMTKVWSDNVIDSDGVSPDIGVGDRFNENKAEYEDSLKALDTWLGIVD